jgi:hypothetical protein
MEKIYEADAIKTSGTTEQNTQEQKNLTNLTPEKLAEISKKTQERLDEIKKQFETEVNGIVARLSKNPEYSSDKLSKFSIVMKNQFNSYVYDQWYNFYQKAGDQEKLVELTKSKKEAEAAFKKSLDELNTAIGEKQQQIQVTKGKKYTYFSKADNKDIEVDVIGKALGQDEKGQQDTAKPEHNTMWKIKTAAGGTFWIPPTAFKTEVAAKPATPVVGQKYNYVIAKGEKKGQTVEATVNAITGENAAQITWDGMKYPNAKVAVGFDKLTPIAAKPTTPTPAPKPTA